MGLALGYEDLNDHERLRLDPLKGSPIETFTIVCLVRRVNSRVQTEEQSRTACKSSPNLDAVPYSGRLTACLSASGVRGSSVLSRPASSLLDLRAMP